MFSTGQQARLYAFGSNEGDKKHGLGSQPMPQRIDASAAARKRCSQIWQRRDDRSGGSQAVVLSKQQRLRLSERALRRQHHPHASVWRTSTLLVSVPDKRRDAASFLTHLDDVSRKLRGYHRIHVLCDNAAFHKSRPVRQ